MKYTNTSALQKIISQYFALFRTFKTFQSSRMTGLTTSAGLNDVKRKLLSVQMFSTRPERTSVATTCFCKLHKWYIKN